MLVRYWQPFREFETLRRQLDQAFSELSDTIEPPTWTPAIELQNDAENVIVRAQLPGIDAKDLDVQVTREAVMISGEHRQAQKTEAKELIKTEFRYGKFQRVIPLPVAVQNDRVQADYTDGILTLTLPKVAEARNTVVKLNLAELNQHPATLDAGNEAAIDHQ